MLLFKTLFLLLSTYGAQCYMHTNETSKVNELELDKALRQIHPFGDPEFTMAHNKAQLTNLCNIVKTWGMDCVAHFLITYGSSEYAVSFINQWTIFTAMRDNQCADLLDPANDDTTATLFPIYKELSDKNAEFKADRDGLTRALIDAAKPGTKARVGTVLCYLSTWLGMASGTKFSDGVRNVIKVWLQGFDQYIITSGILPDIKCDWSGIPEPAGGPQFRSVPLLIVKALANVNQFPEN